MIKLIKKFVNAAIDCFNRMGDGFASSSNERLNERK